MFSRIFATDSAGGPEHPGRPVARGHQHDPRQRREAAVELDDRADVVGVVLAEVGVDLVVDRLELLADLLDLLRREPVQRVLDRGWPSSSSSCCSFGSGHHSLVDLDVALGRVDAGADHLALLAVHLAGAQVAHPARAPAGRCRCGRRPSGSRRRAVPPASSPADQDRRRPVALASTSVTRKRTVPPSPTSARRRRRSSAGSAPCAAVRGSPSRAPVLAASRRACPGARRGSASRSRQSGQSSSRSAGAIRPLSRAEVLAAACSPDCRSLHRAAASRRR